MEQNNFADGSIQMEVEQGVGCKPELMIFVATFSAFLATFNETFLNVAFTSIMADLGVGVATVQWLSTAYMLGAAVMVPISAFLYRSIPTKRAICNYSGLSGSWQCGLRLSAYLCNPAVRSDYSGAGHWDVNSHRHEYYFGSGAKAKIRHLHGYYGRYDNLRPILQRYSGRADFGRCRLACYALVLLRADGALYDLRRLSVG